MHWDRFQGLLFLAPGSIRFMPSLRQIHPPPIAAELDRSAGRCSSTATLSASSSIRYYRTTIAITCPLTVTRAVSFSAKPDIQSPVLQCRRLQTVDR